MVLLSFAYCDNGTLTCTQNTQTCVVGHRYLPGTELVRFNHKSEVEVVHRKGWRVVLRDAQGDRTVLLRTTAEHAETVVKAVQQMIAGKRSQLREVSHNNPLYQVFLAFLCFGGIAAILLGSRGSEAPEPGGR